MAQSNFELVFYGQLAQDTSLALAKEKVAQLFKANSEQVDRMFTGQRVVIRNKLDADTAQKYLAAMEKRGAICQLEIMGKPGVKVDLKKEEIVAENALPVSDNETQSNQDLDAPAATNDKPSAEDLAHASAEHEGSLKLAGDQVETILAQSHLQLDPVGSRLSEEHESFVNEKVIQSELSLAPTGSTLADKKVELPVVEPDISHLSLTQESS